MLIRMCHKQNPSLYSNTSQIVAILVALILISKYTLGVSSELLYKYVCNHWKSFCSVCYFHVTNNLIIYFTSAFHTSYSKTKTNIQKKTPPKKTGRAWLPQYRPNPAWITDFRSNRLVLYLLRIAMGQGQNFL